MSKRLAKAPLTLRLWGNFFVVTWDKAHKTDDCVLPAIKGVDLTIRPGETVALVGESGCGKSVTSLSVMRLLPKYAKVKGSIRFQGQELLDKNEQAMRKIRGREISMNFQEPMTALNPVMRPARYALVQPWLKGFYQHAVLEDPLQAI